MTGEERRRPGMTLLEVMIALVILAGVMLELGNLVTQFVRGTRDSAIVSTASDLTVERIEDVRGSKTYHAIDAWVGTERLGGAHSGFTRVTTVVRAGGGPADIYDYRTVTVSVTGPGMTRPVKKTTLITRF